MGGYGIPKKCKVYSLSYEVTQVLLEVGEGYLAQAALIDPVEEVVDQCAKLLSKHTWL